MQQSPEMKPVYFQQFKSIAHQAVILKQNQKLYGCEQFEFTTTVHMCIYVKNKHNICNEKIKKQKLQKSST